MRVIRRKLLTRPQAEPAADLQQRLWEIDALRGLAVVLMIVFHFTWDLQFFGLAAVDVFSRPWQVFARAPFLGAPACRAPAGAERRDEVSGGAHWSPSRASS